MIFHISKILTPHTGFTVVSKERLTPDGKTETFRSSGFPLARLAEFLTGINMTNPREDDSVALTVNPHETGFADPESLPAQRQVYDARTLLENANNAKAALYRQSGLEWLATVQFPEKEFARVFESSPEVGPAFCEQWVAQLAERFGAWHMLTPPSPRVETAPALHLH